MKAAQVVARGKVQIVDVPQPVLRPGHALVRTQRLSLCGSDIRMLHYAAEEDYPFPPGTTGHEMVGVVEAVDGSAEVKPGDAVMALAPRHEAMAQYFLAPLAHVIPLPAGRPLEHLLQAQQLGTVLYACQRLPNLVGKTVAVIGQGSAGLFFNYQLRQMGARRVVALDVDSNRLNRSRSFGATHVIHNHADAAESGEATQALRDCNEGELADVVVEAAGEVAAINLAARLARQCGDVLYFGYPRGQVIPFDFDVLFHKCVRAQTIVGASVEANQLSTRLALDMVASGRIDVSGLVTHRLPFAAVAEAYEMHRTRADQCLKIVIEMPE
ncbi:MAG: hypothetical protein DCC67_19280 [Planctomycetota bacterium]|nr:MAG: hypothetical protein DCC67_19280 [Planctomycetota bacterium]